MEDNKDEIIPEDQQEYTEYFVNQHQEQTISNRLALYWLSFFILFVLLTSIFWVNYFFVNPNETQTVDVQPEIVSTPLEKEPKVESFPQWVKTVSAPDSAAYFPSSFTRNQLNSFCYHAPVRHQGEIILSGFSPDNQKIFTIGLDNTIIIWEAQNGNCLHIIPLKEPIKPEEYIYPAISLEGNYLALGRQSGIEIYNISTGLFLQRRSWDGRQVEPKLGFLPNEIQLVLNIWHSCYRLARVDKPRQNKSSTLFKDFSYSIFQRRIAGRRGNETFPSIWNSEKLSVTNTIQTLDGYETSVISPDGMRLACCKENEFALISIKSPENVWKHDIDAGWHPTKMFFSENGLNLCFILETTSTENNELSQKKQENSKSCKIQIWDWEKRIKTLDYIVQNSRGVSVCPDASTIITGDSNLLSMMEVESQRIIWPVQSRRVPMIACPDGTYAMQMQNSIEIVEPDLKTCSRVLENSDNVSFITPSSDGKRLAGIRNGSWITWECKTGKRDEYERKKRADNNRLTVCVINPANKGQLLAGSVTGSVLLIDTRQKKNLVFPQKHASATLSIACTSEGKHVISGAKSGTIFMQSIGTEKSDFIKCDTKLKEVYSICLSGDNKYFAASDHSGSVVMVETSSGKIKQYLNNPSQDALESLAWSKDNRYLVGVGKNGNVLVWTVETGEIRSVLKTKTAISRLIQSVFDDSFYGIGEYYQSYVPINLGLYPTGHIKFIEGTLDCKRNGMALCENKSLVAQNTGVECIVWNMETGTVSGKLSGHSQNIVDMASNKNSNEIYTLSEDNTIKKWEALTGKCLQTITLPNPLDSNSEINATKIATSSESEAKLVPISLAVSEDGKSIAVGFTKGLILVQSKGKWFTLSGNKTETLSLDWNHSGTELVSSFADGVIIRWENTNPKVPLNQNSFLPVKTYIRHVGPVWCVKFSPRCDKIVSTGGDDMVCVWVAYSGECLKSGKIGKSGSVLCADWSSDDESITLGDSEGGTTAWNFKKNQVLHTSQNHSAPVWSVKNIDNNKRIVSSGSDMKIYTESL